MAWMTSLLTEWGWNFIHTHICSKYMYHDFIRSTILDLIGKRFCHEPWMVTDHIMDLVHVEHLPKT